MAMRSDHHLPMEPAVPARLAEATSAARAHLRALPAPVLRGRPAPTGRLPVPPTPLVGRAREVTAVRDLLLADGGDQGRGARLVTLIGPGGVGKTRLALAAAAGLGAAAGAAFPGGVWFVPLAALDDPRLMLPEVAAALGAGESGGGSLLDAVRARLSGPPALLVLDTFERLLAAAPDVAALTDPGAVPALRVLVTSRTPLRLAGEHVFPVPPLRLSAPPRSGAVSAPPRGGLGAVHAAVPAEAVQLFVLRARAHLPEFRLTPANTPAVAELCRRVGGLPLAIELAAARVAVLPPEALVAHLDRPLTVLAGGSRDQPERHRTLRDTIAWSYALLPPGARRLFRRLGAFAGGATLDAIAAVGGPDAAPTAPGGLDPVAVARGGTGAGEGPDALAFLDDLALLVDHHLVHRVVAPSPRGAAASPDPGRAPAPRYAMLDTVREFALERLAAGDDDHGERAAGGTGAAAETIRRRHAAYYLALAERAGRGLTGPAQAALFDQLADEHDNLRAVLAWTLTLPEPEPALRLAAVLFRLWYVRGHLSEGRRWLDAVVTRWADAAAVNEMTDSAPAALLAFVLSCAGDLARAQRDDAGARARYEASLVLRRRLGDREGVARSLAGLGLLAAQRGEDGRATALLQESLAEAHAVGDARTAASARWHLAFLALGRGDYAGAVPLADASLAALRALGDAHGIGGVLLGLGAAALRHGDLQRAGAAAEEGLGVMRGLGNPLGMADALRVCAGLAAAAGALARAARLTGAVRALEGVAGGAVGGRGPEAVVSHYLTTADHAWYEREARRYAAAFPADWAAGEALSADEAVAEGLAALGAPPTQPTAASVNGRANGHVHVPPSPPALPPGCRLTAREREVATLVGEGLSNRELAARLIVTVRTAENHVQRLLSKLGLGSRTRLALWARAHLPPPDVPWARPPSPVE